MKKIQHGLGALIILLASLPAVAADFLFQVPVMLDGIPKGIPQAKIICEVFSYRDNQNPIATGYKIKPIDLRDGHLHEEFEVSVNYFNAYRHLKPHQYH